VGVVKSYFVGVNTFQTPIQVRLHKRPFYSLELSEMIRSITMTHGYFEF
jgi:hypothetical protein